MPDSEIKPPAEPLTKDDRAKVMDHLEREEPRCQNLQTLWWMLGARRYEATVAALEAQVEALRSDALCSVCCGRPLRSGRQCICGGSGTEQAEMHGLRVQCFQYEATVQSLEDCLSEIRSIVWERFADYTGDPLFVALSVAFEKHDASRSSSSLPL